MEPCYEIILLLYLPDFIRSRDVKNIRKLAHVCRKLRQLHYTDT